MVPSLSQRVAPLLSPCRLCEVRCGVDRLAGERGPCGVGRQARVYNAFVHLGEEPELSPCLAVFLTGCNFRCEFCSDGPYVDRPLDHGVPLSATALADRARRALAEHEIRGVEFVGGVPDIHLLSVAEACERLPSGLEIALNTNGWFTPEALDVMTGWVDILVVDLKFGPGACGSELAQVKGYWPTVTRNLALASAAGFRLIVRHLLMPGHLECCTRPVLTWVSRHLPDARPNVMTGYRPLHRSRGGPRLRAEERGEGLRLARNLLGEACLVDGRPVG